MTCEELEIIDILRLTAFGEPRFKNACNEINDDRETTAQRIPRDLYAGFDEKAILRFHIFGYIASWRHICKNQIRDIPRKRLAS